MKIKKTFLLVLAFLVLAAIFPQRVLAADLSIDCPATPSTPCTKSGPADPLFTSSADGFWYPGRTLTKVVNLKNSSSSQTRDMAIKGERKGTSTILENVMQISIVGGTTVVWAGSVADFYNQAEVAMGTFSSGTDLDYDFTVSMDSSAGDAYKNLTTVFDLTISSSGEEEASTPIPTPTSGAGDGGGAVLGAGVSAPVCSDTAPAEAPNLISAVPGVNSVTLFWSEGAGPISYYLIAYGTSSGVYSFGNPNIGGPGTTSFTVNDLSGRVTYYFVVRAGNGCAPGPFSNELSATPSGGAITGPAAGFFPGVLGVATSSAELTGMPSATGEIAGEVVEITPFAAEGKPAPWGIIFALLLAGGVLVLILFWRSRKR